MIFLRFYFNDDDDVDVAKCYAKPFMTDGWERKRGEREKRERRGGGINVAIPQNAATMAETHSQKKNRRHLGWNEN